MANSVAYLIQRRAWGYNDEFYYEEGRTTLTAFKTRESAEAHLKTLDNSGLDWANPFYEIGEEWSDVTSLKEAEFHDRVKELGLPDPKKSDSKWISTVSNWGDWWEELNDEQRRQVRPLCDNVTSFVIVEVPLDDLTIAE